MNFKSLNIAEWFSLSRILTFPIVLLLVFLEEREITAWFYIIMFSTDFIDGFFAFILDMDGKRRALLDSWGDILYILAGLFGFYTFEKDFFIEHLPWLYIVGFLYMVQLIIIIVRFGKPSSFHTYLAKLATFFQVVFIGFMFFFTASSFLFYLAIVLTILEVIEEIIMSLIIKEWKENIKGLWALNKEGE